MIQDRKEGFTTTFWQDFSIADAFGVAAIKDTFKRAFAEWKGRRAEGEALQRPLAEGAELRLRAPEGRGAGVFLEGSRLARKKAKNPEPLRSDM